MEIGKRNRRIIFLQYHEIRNDEGVYVKRWDELSKVWAYIKPFSGSQVYSAQADEHKASVKVNIRYNKSISSDLRVQIYEEIYEIGHIEDVDFTHDEMWITLEKVI